MRAVGLSAVKAGIQRLRSKGGANPESLHDLVNGYVTSARSIKSRPGTEFVYTLPSDTRGMMPFRGKIYTFTHLPQTIADSRFVAESVIHPTDPASPLADIHFAQPFLGVPYVVAEFQNGDIYHYWLQHRDPWQSETNYLPGDIVEPTTPNGYAYRAASIGEPGLAWAPNVVHEVGDVVEPTESNGYRYTATDVAGDPPHTGDVEPTWTAEDGAEVIEISGALVAEDAVTGTGGTSDVPIDISDRYGRYNGKYNPEIEP